MFIPPHMTPNSPDGAMGEGIAIDAAGNIYTAEATEGRDEIRQGIAPKRRSPIPAARRRP